MIYPATLQALADFHTDPAAALDYLKRVAECLHEVTTVVLPIFSALMRIDGWEHAIVGGEFAIIEFCAKHTEVFNALTQQFPPHTEGVDASAIYMSGLVVELQTKCWKDDWTK